MSGRRFASESDVLGELERLHFLSLSLVGEFQTLAVTAAQAEAEHKRLRSRRVLLAKATGTRSIAEAEHEAEADQEVAAAYMERLTAAAKADGTREAMRSIRTNQEALRTMAASHRPEQMRNNP